MKLKLFLQASSNLYASNKLYKLTTLLLTAVIIFYIYRVEYIHSLNTVIVTAPTLKNVNYIINNERFDDAYLDGMATFLTNLAYTYHPQNVESNFEKLLAYYSAGVYPNAKKELYALLKDLQRTNTLTSVFARDKIITNDRDMIYVQGRLTERIQRTIRKDENVTIAIKYKRGIGGKFEMISLLLTDKKFILKEES